MQPRLELHNRVLPSRCPRIQTQHLHHPGPSPYQSRHVRNHPPPFPLQALHRHRRSRACVDASAARFPARPLSGEKLITDHAPKAKRVIYLFMSGGPSQQDLFDYKPKLNELNGQQLPDPSAAASASPACRATRPILPARRLAVQVRPTRQIRRVGQRAAAPHRQGRGRPLLREIPLDRGDQPRSRDDLFPNRLADRRPALARLMGHLRPRLGEREPARLRRARHQKAPPTNRSTPASGAPASSTPATRACVSPPARTRSSTSPIPTASANPAAARCSTSSPPSTRSTSRTNSTPRSRPASPSTKWPTACRPACRK